MENSGVVRAAISKAFAVDLVALSHALTRGTPPPYLVLQLMASATLFTPPLVKQQRMSNRRIHIHLTSRAMNRSTNNTTHSASGIGRKMCGVLGFP